MSVPLIPENPPGFIVTEEAHKAAYENGFRVELGLRNGWLGYCSTTAKGEVWIARAAACTGTTGGNPWLLSLTHPGVIAELQLPAAEAAEHPGFTAYAFPTLGDLYRALDRAYKLGASLPNAPLEVFRKITAALPNSTEAERLSVVRIGQDLFRQALLDYWNGRCPLTGITDTALLRASHIVGWAECENDALRLSVHNGLLLSALWDCAFDAGLVSFSDEGAVLRSPRLTEAAMAALRITPTTRLSAITPAHHAQLSRHRTKYGFEVNVESRSRTES